MHQHSQQSGVESNPNVYNLYVSKQTSGAPALMTCMHRVISDNYARLHYISTLGNLFMHHST